ncbi:protein FAR1-RELATED SEQUENCE 5-like [Pyrus ussuriensis x Pyrus communis]|uniref:Protein FAR1-RELATED SEQUENCE 5-like n=1 Tax=Pyrus ussuriensis x Pyrus communis TaxID=2448454 RepID=A0A5N5GBJ9_9ROSA|nr:protein FAR1-RELATED SEQUENCE 5-like [Pyrus ussuriensis x Pyrus communis]
MKLVEKDMKAKKVSNKLNKKNSLFTSGVQDDLYWILQPLKSALEKSNKVAKVRHTSQVSPPNTILYVDILNNTTLSLLLQACFKKLSKC